MSGKIGAVYFSPTRTTQKIVGAVAETLAGRTGKETKEIDLTLPGGRGVANSFGADDVLIFGFPVYGGRIPKFLAPELEKLRGEGTPAVVVAVYGNRDYDDALLEAVDILTANGFRAIAAGAFIGEHSYSFKLAAGRPDESDLAAAKRFAGQIADKLAAGSAKAISVKGNRPYKDQMPDMPFLPKTKDSCTDCKLCARICPMGIISEEDPKIVKPVCIACHACVKSCPVGAKYFDAERVAQAAAMLESKFAERKEPELFV